jgi:hypothetical protein
VIFYTIISITEISIIQYQCPTKTGFAGDRRANGGR